MRSRMSALSSMTTQVLFEFTWAPFATSLRAGLVVVAEMCRISFVPRAAIFDFSPRGAVEGEVATSATGPQEMRTLVS